MAVNPRKFRTVTEGGKVVTRRQLEHSLKQLADHFLLAFRQLEEHFDEQFAEVRLRLRLLETTAGYHFRYDGDTGRRFGPDEGWPEPQPSSQPIEVVDGTCAPPQSEIDAFREKLTDPHVAAGR